MSLSGWLANGKCVRELNGITNAFHEHHSGLRCLCVGCSPDRQQGCRRFRIIDRGGSLAGRRPRAVSLGFGSLYSHCDSVFPCVCEFSNLHMPSTRWNLVATRDVSCTFSHVGASFQLALPRQDGISSPQETWVHIFQLEPFPSRHVSTDSAEEPSSEGSFRGQFQPMEKRAPKLEKPRLVELGTRSHVVRPSRVFDSQPALGRHLADENRRAGKTQGRP